MFLDESGDSNLQIIDRSYPIFCLAGCIVEFNYYTSVFEKEVNALKMDFFGRRDVVLRSYDIRKQKNDFSILIDKKKRVSFYTGLDNLVKKLNFTVIAAVINKENLKEQYSHPANPYNLCFQFIMERFCMFLGEKHDSAILRIESRETHNDKLLAKEYERFRNKGNNIFSSEEVMGKLVDLSFNQKSQNIAGHQVADLVAYPIGRHIFKAEKNHVAFQLVESKLHKKSGTNSYLNCGLKIFP